MELIGTETFGSVGSGVSYGDRKGTGLSGGGGTREGEGSRGGGGRE